MQNKYFLKLFKEAEKEKEIHNIFCLQALVIFASLYKEWS